MLEPELTDPDPESANTHPQKILCTKHNREAKIVVAKWPFCEEGWSDWRVIDCSLLPPGAVRCGMECLSQARSKDQ